MTARQLIAHLEAGLATLGEEDVDVILWVPVGDDDKEARSIEPHRMTPDATYTAEGFCRYPPTIHLQEGR